MKKRHMRTMLTALAAGFLIVGDAAAQQVADPHADLSVASPAFAQNAGPRLVIDGGHHNFHTVDGRYAPFAQLMRNNGFRVSGSSGPFTDRSLRDIDILVIANALNEVNDGSDKWRLPTPSAFTPEEITRVRQWVEGGGSLLLIADHMPLAGAAHDLGAAFGINFENGFAFSAPPESMSAAPDLFTRENGGLVDDPRIANVRQVRTFTGSAFTASGANVHPLIRLGRTWTVLSPAVAWEFNAQTPRTSGEGKLQGALLEVGRGRVAVFGEAAMFTAQVTGAQQTPMGLRAPGAEENKQFALDIANWLARKT